MLIKLQAGLGASRRRRLMIDIIALVDQGDYSAAWHCCQAMGPNPPGSHEGLITSLLDDWMRLSEDEKKATPVFCDNRSLNQQFVSCGPSGVRRDRLLLVFCDMGQRFGGCPLNLLHRVLGRLGINLLYLRDQDDVFYLNGFRQDGFDLTTTIRRIQALANEHSISTILAMGSSSGGFAALHWGLALEARRILSLAGPTDLSRSLHAITEKQAALGVPTRLRADRAAAAAAERLRYQHCRSRFHLVHAAANNHDKRFARDLGLPLPAHVTVEPLPDSQAHNVMIPLVQQRRLRPLLLELVGPG